MTKKRIVTLVLAAVIPLLIGAAIAGFSIWYDNNNYVKSTTARVSGSQVIVSSPGSGDILELPLDVGDTVQQGQTLAMVDLSPQQVLAGPSEGDVRAPIKAPIDGTIIRRYVHVGERAAAGAPLFSLVDRSKLYVVADVDESKVPMIEVGQPVQIYLRAFDKNVDGQVAGLTPATSDLVTSTPQAQQSNSTPQVPILIDFNGDTGLPIVPGMSAEVSIKIR